MRFVCDSCRAQYTISDDKVGAKGVKVRCKKCGFVILVRPAAGVSGPPVLHPVTAPNDASSEKKLPLGGVDDDEIGAVFDQVLSSGTKAAAPPSGQSPFKEDDASSESTRVLDVSMLKKLAQDAGGSEGAASESERADSASDEPKTMVVAPPVNDWFVAIDDKQIGPLGLDKIKDHWERGEIGPDTLCWRAGFADWTAVSEIPELAALLAPKPARPAMVAASASGAAATSNAPVQSAFAAGKSTGGGGSALAATTTTQDGAWKPSAASALASLAQDEIDAFKKPAAKTPFSAATPGLLDVPEASVPPSDRVTAPVVSPAQPASHVVPTSYVAPPPAYASPPSARGPWLWMAGGFLLVLLVLASAVVYLLFRKEPMPTPEVAASSSAPAEKASKRPSRQASAPPTTDVDSPPQPPALPPGPPPVVAAVPPPVGAVEPPKAGELAALSKPRRERARRTEPGEATSPRASSPRDEPAFGNSDDEFAREFGVAADAPVAPVAKKKPKNVVVPPPPGSAELPETLGTSDVMQAVLAHRPEIVRCVEEQKKRDPGLSGTLVVRWTVQTNGTARGVSAQNSEFKSTYLAGCIVNLVKGWTFPKHRQQGDPIDFPFKF
ncbi:MAG: AgmX/PglI C-terminal domain-containing protein [Myxococcaceae bacterium]